MDDAEAEAVLLALGPRLEWAYETDPSWAPNSSEVWESKAERYHVFHLYSGEYACWTGTTSSFSVSTLEAAKAACERHYATGKWD